VKELKSGTDMNYDKDKVDEMTLALLWLVLWDEQPGSRAWKGFEWETLNRLHEKGFILDPKRRAKSVSVTPAGRAKAEELFRKHFGQPEN
jgi:hypothetical protein